MLVWRPSFAQKRVHTIFTVGTLKNWALSHLSGIVYTKMMSLKTMPKATASACLEYGKQSVEIYHEIDEICENIQG